MIPLTIQIQEKMEHMVNVLKQNGRLSSDNVEKSFRSIPRHLFINRLREGQHWVTLDPFHPKDEYLDKIYSADNAIVLHKDGGDPTSSSAPDLMAMMLDGLDLDEGMKVLEIGTGTGYNAALLANIAGEDLVYSIENQPEVAKEAKTNIGRAGFQRIYTICEDGSCGYPQGAPYHRIIATASIFDLPAPWLEQLVEGGILVAPLWMAPGFSPTIRLIKHGDVLTGHFLGGLGCMALKGVYGYEELGCMVDPDKEEGLAKLLDHPIVEDLNPLINVTDPSHLRIRFMEFNAFINMLENRAIGIEVPSKNLWSWLALWDREVPSLVALWLPDWRVGVYGSNAMYKRIKELLAHWNEINTPEMSSYKINVFRGMLPNSKRDQFTFSKFKRWNTWEFSLPTHLNS